MNTKIEICLRDAEIKIRTIISITSKITGETFRVLFEDHVEATDWLEKMRKEQIDLMWSNVQVNSLYEPKEIEQVFKGI